jgi:hypothetical protein
VDGDVGLQQRIGVEFGDGDGLRSGRLVAACPSAIAWAIVPSEKRSPRTIAVARRAASATGASARALPTCVTANAIPPHPVESHDRSHIIETSHNGIDHWAVYRKGEMSHSAVRPSGMPFHRASHRAESIRRTEEFLPALLGPLRHSGLDLGVGRFVRGHFLNLPASSCSTGCLSARSSRCRCATRAWRASLLARRRLAWLPSRDPVRRFLAVATCPAAGRTRCHD